MLDALFLGHAEDPWKVNELAAIYLLVYVSLFLTGSGQFSVDHICLDKRNPNENSGKE